ncbi:3-hydroxybutyryl-CoA dehydrogenase [Sulfitobacter pseudonitzschiae]|uniref:3-hydroxybutyryl-CoA dehydrogenase n=1 Tax=Pseudosulfitobacter pseudonitzschiae TaxID=1402135 RepID=A0A9Q2NQY7_9RHOB|nr:MULTISPECIES: 3-hydroxybutyryl-CoA dehydrogenase [Roseobacteraceae]MBM2292661.1 3-hydroxybutyryl-CoA dehydrogenase [Pseudosulfitobacter pseudonitzschiae]MBM2297578.1 3-hydroxybutyryl-CoA dehydrogenase [Pseudosulfitobacter pseudonitzschiae]MBM2302492.1 3-hydroxybutyryl-CoA dehydrogenase [Pseudosulfitobacter pseudonitzschiae]MBM2312275.1 3-hydroxybutyryl-CoA dehydrogenase [Pseudosulfitobacter pseudonitzschiae]MBM2317188.1 3-hydroxybutyryl-CoA dehydrogenase [Pseudosulfitobacter pseudonitzschia|tara:strand:+ start:1431 stop:2306 length:876 start_codon:yes stop_codon:yes gene_type:complete
MDIKTVGIVGAGQMGNGIAHVMALAGYDVTMTDISEDALQAAIKLIDGNMERQVSRDKITAEAKAEAMARIATTVTLTDLGPSDLIIEAATERETVKQAIFEDLLPHLKPHTILTSNTSSISITRLASRTDRPEKFMGFHFMNPVPVMQLVELIRGIATDAETYDACKQVVDKLGKTAASAEDFPAFIVNRILMPMINEAVYTLYEGVGNVQSIDSSMKLGANHPMGPLELADFIGLDTCLAIMNVLHDGLADTKYRPCPLLTKYVEAGWLGRKTQRGFYDYRGETPVPTR